MIRRLGAEFYLPQPLVYILRGLADGLGKEFRIHEMGAGAGCQVAAVFNQFHAPQVDLPVAFDCFFDGASGLGEGRRVKNDHVEFLPLFLQPREQLKHILAEELHPVGEAVQFRIFSCLGHAQFGCVHAQHVLRP